MCELCLCSGGHVPGCPYYESPYPTERRRSVFVCRICGKAIYHGDEVLDIAGGEEFVHADCFFTSSHDELIQKEIFTVEEADEGCICAICGKGISLGEKAVFNGLFVHADCFRRTSTKDLLPLMNEPVQEYY